MNILKLTPVAFLVSCVSPNSVIRESQMQGIIDGDQANQMLMVAEGMSPDLIAPVASVLDTVIPGAGAVRTAALGGYAIHKRRQRKQAEVDAQANT